MTAHGAFIGDVRDSYKMLVRRPIERDALKTYA
jgi:hypothetical protein